MPVGNVYLPGAPGAPVGKFSFLIDSRDNTNADQVEVGTYVAVDTDEGVVIGSVIDINAVGDAGSPVEAMMSMIGGNLKVLGTEALLATAQVLASDRLRPVRAGRVRLATIGEILNALGQDKIDFKVPVGTVNIPGGGMVPVGLDGPSVLGPESAGLIVVGRSGMAAKTSFLTVALRSAMHASQERGEGIGAVLFNVKGSDLLFLDNEPAPGYELTEADKAMYASMGVPATPFPDVTVYGPALPGAGTSSARDSAIPLQYDIASLWQYIPLIYPNSSENLVNLMADMRDNLLNHPSPNMRLDTIDKLDDWFNERFEELDRAAEDPSTPGSLKTTFWKSHHMATGRQAHRRIMSLVPRFGGLLGRGRAQEGRDIPRHGWRDGQVIVVDLANLHPDVQGIVIARTVKRLMESAEEGELGVERLVFMADELNKWAPRGVGGEYGMLRKAIEDVSARGRYAGTSLFGAAQQGSRISETVFTNASTRALGVTDDSELGSGLYGRNLSSGFVEQIETLNKGQMAVWHTTFRRPVIVNFPRPAWATGKSKSAVKRKDSVSVLGLSEEGQERLIEGVGREAAKDIVAAAGGGADAIEALKRFRVPDMKRVDLQHNTPRVDDSDPFGD